MILQFQPLCSLLETTSMPTVSNSYDKTIEIGLRYACFRQSRTPVMSASFTSVLRAFKVKNVVT